MGKDDLEDISDEEVDWSNDGENIMIVEESIDEEESNCEFTNEREVIERPTVFDRLGHRSPVVKDNQSRSRIVLEVVKKLV